MSGDDASNVVALFDLIGVLARRRYQTAERHFSVLGLNHSEARLLTLLLQADGASTQDALSSRLFLDRSNAGRALKNLEQGGYVERSKQGVDKRTNRVQITAKGRTAAAAIARLKSKIARDLFGDLTDAEAGEIIGLLKKAPMDEGTV